MRKIALISTLLFLHSGIFSQPEKNYTTKNERKIFYQQFSQTYCSSAIQEIFNSDTDNSFEDYVDGHTEKDLVGNYETVIHELLHGYNNSEINGHNYFIDTGIKIYVPFTKYFNSKELNSYVRKGVQDSVFRYGLYVGGKNSVPGFEGKMPDINSNKNNEVMSVSQGIYGLVEEFNAYFYGNSAQYELFGYYTKTYGKDDSEILKKYKDKITEAAIPYYEFNLFIGYYLLYAKTKHPDIYKEIINNKALKVVYTLLDNKYKTLLENIENKVKSLGIKEEPDVLSTLDLSGSDEDFMRYLDLFGPQMIVTGDSDFTLKGKTISEIKKEFENEFYVALRKTYDDVVKEIKKETRGKTLLLFQTNSDLMVPYLKKLLNTKLTDELNKFRISGVNTTNYKEFMK